MRDARVTSFETEQLPRGVRFVLSQRNLPKARLAGLPGLMFGLVFAGFAVFWMAMASRSMWDSDGRFEWFGLLFALFGVPFVLAGLAMVFGSLVLLFGGGRAVVKLRDDQLIGVEMFGPLRWRRRRNINGIEQLRIGPAVEASQANDRRKSSFFAAMAGTSAIHVEGSQIHAMKLAPGYPAGVLEELALALAQRIGRNDRVRIFDDDESLGPRVLNAAGLPLRSDGSVDRSQADQSSVPDESEPVPCQPRTQPMTSRIVVEEQEDALTIHVPPIGLWGSRLIRSMFVFSIIWDAVTSVVAVSLLVAVVTGNMPWPALFALLFPGIGIVMLVYTIYLAKRQAIIDVIGPALLITRQSIFGTQQDEWAADQLDCVTVEPSGTEINDKPLMQLTIKSAQRNPVHLLVGRDEEELRWLASLLNQALGLDERHSNARTSSASR